MSKKAVKIILIVILVILALIGIENMFRAIKWSREVVKDNKEQKKIEEEYKQSHEYKVTEYLSNCIELSINLLASGDFDTIYSKLDESYKDYMQFTAVDDFKSFMNEYMGTPVSAELVSQREQNNKYVCEVSIETKKSVNNYTVIIEPRGEDYRITFGDIKQILSYKGVYKTTMNSLSCDIIYKVKESNSWVYAIEVTNRNDKTIKGSFANSYLERTDKKEYDVINASNYEEVEIKPNETVRMNFRFNVEKGFSEDSNLYVIYEENDERKAEVNMILNDKYWL